MSDSGKFYDANRELKRAAYFKTYSANDGTTRLMIDVIAEKIAEYGTGAVSVLDLGTGNGFLLHEVAKKHHGGAADGSLYIGIDSSADMIELAKQQDESTALQFKVMDNAATSFTDDQFDFVIAKAVSNIDEREVARILKPGGWFIYKEYGLGKGIVELLAPDYISANLSHPGSEMLAVLQNLAFEYVEMRQFSVAIQRTKSDVESLLNTMRILPAHLTMELALAKVATYYGNNDSMLVHSDPFIVLGRR